MSDITDYSKNYSGATRGVKYDTIEAEVSITAPTVTVSTAITAPAITAATSVDSPVYKVGGVAVKMPVLSGEYTTTGGAAAEAATITGVAVGDIVIATLKDNGTSSVTLLTSTENTVNTVDFTFSANPGNDTIVSYLILR